jgi:hypothetical protein
MDFYAAMAMEATVPSKTRFALDIQKNTYTHAVQILVQLDNWVRRNWPTQYAKPALEILAAKRPLLSRLRDVLKIVEDRHLRLHVWRERAGVNLRESRFKRYMRDCGFKSPAVQREAFLNAPKPQAARKKPKIVAGIPGPNLPDIPNIWNEIPVAYRGADGTLYYRDINGELHVIPGRQPNYAGVPAGNVAPAPAPGPVRIGIFR